MFRTPKVATLRLRVSDKVLETFEYACLMRDFDAAERLLAVLEHMAERRVRRFGGDRRGSMTPALEQARTRLEQLRAAQASGV